MAAKKSRLVLGLDGEGHSTKSGRHLYTYLAASDSTGEIFFDVENPKGLTTKEIFDFLLELPAGALKGGFALGYDFTKWLENLPDREIYLLYRPDLRAGKNGPNPRRIPIEGRLYGVNLVATKLSVMGDWNKGKAGFNSRCSVWDLFRFFQKSFVASLREWGVGTENELLAIQKMKDARGNFSKIGDKEKAYCRSEVRLLAALWEKLIEACEEAEIPLRDFFGAGSLGAATLRNGPAKQEIVTVPKRMRKAVSCAFFGGRFEQSARGPILSSEGYDLASAYPYAETQLPCLRHGTWKHVRKNVEKEVRRARAACVRYSLAPRTDVVSREFWDYGGVEACVNMPELSERVRVSEFPWGPFPFRLEDGSILFPVESAGGWVWRPEILAVLDNPQVWPNLRLHEAWVLKSKCRCEPPFLKEISGFYLKRLEWGKEAKGLVLKKGLASRYGKRAQTVGKAPFHCGVAAGMITSHTRGEILRAIATDPNAILSVATDGIIARKKLQLRAPLPTGTGEKKPLGMWEHKESGAIFLMRPGMRFAIELSSAGTRRTTGDTPALSCSRDADDRGACPNFSPRISLDVEGNDTLEGTTAARGVGVKKLHAERAAILAAWSDAAEGTSVPRGTIFNGAKLSITKLQDGTYKRSPKYGRWTAADDFKVSYAPLPKRPWADSSHRLLTWALTRHDGTSAPYDPIAERADLLELREAQDEAECQPDLETGVVE